MQFDIFIPDLNLAVEYLFVFVVFCVFFVVFVISLIILDTMDHTITEKYLFLDPDDTFLTVMKIKDKCARNIT